jgi:chromate transporter
MTRPAALGAGAVDVRARPSFANATCVWAKIGWLSFGGPAGQIALMHRELVEARRWISESRFMHALSYCMLLPGPEAQQLAIYIGWLMHRTAGGIVAGVLFVVPGIIVILALSWLYAVYGHVPPIAAVFFGLKAAVLAIVVEAVLRIGRRALKNRLMLALAFAAFTGIFFLKIPFPFIVLGAGICGAVAQRFLPQFFTADEKQYDANDERYIIDGLIKRRQLLHIHPSAPRALRTLSICIALWFLPVLSVAVWLGSDSVLAREGAFFSWAAVVTFGGAYAVLAYVAQQVVEKFAWVTAGQMIDGLALAETTPGPLIMVVQFVAFLAAYQHPGSLSPVLAGVLGSFLTTWVTFVPCFLWIFLGAPYIEALRTHRVLRAALAAIMAAVVGVILNLSVWFALHTIFGKVDERRFGMIRLQVPAWGTIDMGAAALSSAALIAMLRYKVRIGWTLGSCALLGGTYRLLI